MQFADPILQYIKLYEGFVSKEDFKRAPPCQQRIGLLSPRIEQMSLFWNRIIFPCCVCTKDEWKVSKFEQGLPTFIDFFNTKMICVTAFSNFLPLIIPFPLVAKLIDFFLLCLANKSLLSS
jgi:hypothetical protein